jgi:RND family efflux transporter MFP subunit
VVALLVLGLAGGCKHHQTETTRQHKGKATPAASPAPPPRVDFAQVTVRSIAERVEMSGTVTANDPVNVSPQLTARVKSVLADEGDMVSAGQTLLVLDDSDQRIQMMQDQAALRQDYARLGLKPGQKLTDRNKVPAVKKTLAVLENQKANYERYVDLRRQELVSDSDLANALQSYKTAQDDYESALEQVEQDLAGLGISEAKLEKDRQQLGYTTVVSPIDGVVQEKKVSLGDLAQSGSPAFVLADVRDLYLTVAVPEEYAPQLAAGKIFRGTAATVPPLKVSAKIKEINPVLDSATRTLSVKATVVGAPPGLRPGMFVNVVFETGKHSTDLLIPQAAVLTQAGVSHIYMLEPSGQRQTVTDHEVTLGDPVEDWIEVSGPVTRADRVAASNLAALKDGLEVTLGRELPPPKPAR